MFDMWFPRHWSTLKKLIWLYKGVMKAASWVWKTVTGSLLHITDALAGNVSALSVDINPVQSGSGDPAPDNVRPISGWAQAKVTRTGKNLLDCSGAITSTASNVTFTNNNDGTWTLNGTASAFAGKAISANRILNLKAGVTYKITGGVTNLVNAYLYKAGVGVLKTDTGLGATYTPAEDIVDVDFYLSMTAGKVANNLVAYPMLSIDGTGTGWEPYTEQTLPISWQSEAGTVYGGTLDVTTGVLTVTHKAVDMGTLGWEYQSQYTRFYVDIPDMVRNPYVRAKTILTPIFKCLIGGTAGGVDNCIYNAGADLPQRIFAQHFDLTDPQDFISFVNGYLVVYELATPQTVQLDPETLTLLAGENYVWCDTGDISLTYKAAEPNNKVGTAKVGTAKQDKEDLK